MLRPSVASQGPSQPDFSVGEGGPDPPGGDWGGELRISVMVKCAWILGVGVALGGLAAGSDVRELPDQGESDPSFVRFRQELGEVVERRDLSGLMAIVDPGIKVSFGGEGGAAEFRRMWGLEQDDPRVWEVLARLLGMGAERTDDGFILPFMPELPEEMDPFDVMFVEGLEVPVRSRPEPEAPVVVTVSGRYLEIAFELDEVPGWTAVRIEDGVDGYVASSDAYSPVGYRAFFREVEGSWRMTVLIAGD